MIVRPSVAHSPSRSFYSDSDINSDIAPYDAAAALLLAQLGGYDDENKETQDRKPRQ